MVVDMLSLIQTSPVSECARHRPRRPIWDRSLGWTEPPSRRARVLAIVIVCLQLVRVRVSRTIIHRDHCLFAL
jgi:hypothetical protein